MKNSLLPVLFLLCLALPAFGQEARVSAALWGAPAPDGDDYILGLDLVPQQGWHTYWKNSGDAGLPTHLHWTLPAGVTLGSLHWPTPHAYAEGSLMTYGYGAAHTLVQRLHIDAQVADSANLRLKARWLVCKDICIPESAELEIGVGAVRQQQVAGHRRATKALQALPEALAAEGRFAIQQGSLHSFLPLPPAWHQNAEELLWFPAARNLVAHAEAVQWHADGSGLLISQPLHPDFTAIEQFRGVLVRDDGKTRHALEIHLQAGEVPTDMPRLSSGSTAPPLGLWLALAMAFVGGLILNLMPCVFPVLTLKALSLTRAESDHVRRIESLAYAAGVLLSFLLIATILLALRASGAALGWGFQLQNPLVVSALAVLMLILGLAMLGWTQIGMGMMGAGQNLTQDGGIRGAFFTGVLAVVVASPCSAPFMGGALGYAVLQPPPIALSIFLALGAGLAAPFVILAWIPALARRLPRPGPWMERLKHWMALPLFLTGVWLLWVLWRQSGWIALTCATLSAGLLALALRQSPRGWQPSARQVRLALAGALALLLAPNWLATSAPRQGADEWQAWSPATVAEARARQQTILVDFTADWCLSCIVNEQAVLADEDIQALLDEHDVLLLKADWTQYDPEITAALAEHGRNGVPLYLLYPRNSGPAEILPQILTKRLVSEAIKRAAR